MTGFNLNPVVFQPFVHPLLMNPFQNPLGFTLVVIVIIISC
jgi:hypothetical protein